MKVWPHPIKAVIFDSDGVIMDTVPMYNQATEEVIGQEIPDSFIITINGLSEHVFGERLIAKYNLSMTADQFVRRRLDVLHNLLPTAKRVAGIDRIIKKLREMNIPMAVATSATRESHQRKTMNHREFFGEYFQYELCGDEVSNAKPSPEIFQKAAAKIGNIKPENVLVFEDAVNGIKAACSAGMASVLRALPGVDYSEELKRMDATPSHIVNHFDQFNFDVFTWETV